VFYLPDQAAVVLNFTAAPHPFSRSYRDTPFFTPPAAVDGPPVRSPRAAAFQG
jgi:hypothetical protein